MSYNKIGFNIDRLVAENEQYAQAEVYANGLVKTTHTCQWHEKQYRIGSRPSQHTQMRDQLGAAWETMGEGQLGDKDEMTVELNQANKAVVLERRARLKALLDGEQVKFENELNGMGLSIAKERL